MRKIIISFLLTCCCLNLFASQPRSFNVIIQELKDNNKILLDHNNELKKIIEDDNLTIDVLKQRLQIVETNLDKSIEENAIVNAEIIQQTNKIKNLNLTLTIIILVLVFFFVLHFIILFLKIKWNITLPYWLNSIL